MKKIYSLCLFLFAANLLSAHKMNDSYVPALFGENKMSASDYVNIQKDKDLVLNLVTENSQKLLRVSFNGNEGMEGDLKIFNRAKEQKAEFNFELIKFPNYATVDITDLPPGTYTIELHTKKAIHTSRLTIQ